MPFFRGGDMFSIMQNKGKMPEDWARFYIMQVSIALGYLHQNGVVYRDVKPENILMDDKGYIALSDFGGAKLMSKDKQEV